MQFLNLNESDGQKMNTQLSEHKFSYSYKQLLAFILAFIESSFWKVLLFTLGWLQRSTFTKKFFVNDFKD